MINEIIFKSRESLHIRLQVTGIYNNWNPNEDELKELVYMNPTATAIMVMMNTFNIYRLQQF